MGEIIKHNFGKEDREHARRFASLLKIVLDQEEDILANPGKYLALASERLAEQEFFFLALLDAIRIPWSVNLSEVLGPPAMLQPDVVRIDRRDYDVLQALKKLIRDRDNRT